ncbi:Mucin-associated surface protein (MASP) [Trypanosoma cruzi]|uniref:Mucin-associated surface protein (MASP), putative n=3 Tax=Trypanosoma cruzi TaxID=5693 RepID=Q4DIE4_TRYCC|nr:mucin-associated surface protein (MASP), putative [Trypanosoma cruzi]EAN92306.1 mucin-associated surface protein (MASP), putative [Trypanosoma cruzi]PWV17715.1 Mucin-associated surface protein (MASP) [Trypanosoma cruzi]|eukprot:XP_814157.1 mucin-associated surface protein (MASP) [Trypanosoma cruzi strain CL Brener]
MAMMTGRVLLVCALCVLWCGSGGRCEEEVVPVADLPANSESGSGGPEKDTDHTVPGGAENLSAQQSQLNKVRGSPPGISSLEAPSEVESKKKHTQSDPEHTDLLSPSKSSGEQRQDGTPDGTPGRLATSHSQEDRKHPSIEGPERNGPPSSSSNNNTVGRKSEERTEDTPSSTEIIVAAPSEEGQERENVAASLEQPEGNSTAAPAITTQTISTTPTDDGTVDTVRMSDAAEQSTGTAQTNHTMTPGDSDSSTAVSHTTSPLLLLLVVACAAAAAVLAA